MSLAEHFQFFLRNSHHDFSILFKEIARNLKQNKTENEDVFTEIQLDEGDALSQGKSSLGNHEFV